MAHNKEKYYRMLREYQKLLLVKIVDITASVFEQHFFTSVIQVGKIKERSIEMLIA